jgi:hypothetical protein
MLNADCTIAATDQLLVRVIATATNSTVQGFGFDNSIAFTGNATAAAAQWQAGKSMQALAGQVLALEVRLVGQSARLYSLAGSFSM